MTDRRFLLVGGAGFVGSHFTDRLLGRPETERVTLYDNFSSGRVEHFAHHAGDPRLEVVRGDVHDLEALTRAMQGHDLVVHLASNPDIAAAARDPDIDFREGTELTRNVAEALRRSCVPWVLYASGSGIYGETGLLEVREDHGPLEPISTYGASKLAGEALLCSYAHMFGFQACAFRFANVVGRRQTHGVGFDFARRLLQDPTRLAILGDGTQRKSYIWVGDILDAVFLARERSTEPFDAFNVGTGDSITVTEIADLACRAVGLDPREVEYVYSGGDRGWRGDVPVIRLDIAKIRSLGWSPTRSSAGAVEEAIRQMLPDLRATSA